MNHKNTSRKVLVSHQEHKSLLPSPDKNTLPHWLELYFAIGVTAGASSQKVQKRDLQLFITFVFQEEQNESIYVWTPRLTRAFIDNLKQQINAKTGERRFGGRTIQRIFSHLKTWGKWVHQKQAFPLGNPVEGHQISINIPLNINRALSSSERRKMLDTSDYLPIIGGRKRNVKGKDLPPEERPRRKAYRAWRNRAIIYTLIETGMRRTAITMIDLSGVNIEKQTLKTIEKGGKEKIYTISKTGIKAITDYIHHERGEDSEYWQMSPALFLPSYSRTQSKGRLSARNINIIWNETRDLAGICKDKTPHSARHSMGRYMVEKTGNISAVQKQLNHDSPYYSMQYSQMTEQEMKNILNER